MTTTINQRLKEYIEEKKITPSDIYSKIGATRIVWSNWMNGGAPISVGKLQLIIGLLPTVNVRWLMTGETTNGEGEIADQNSGECKVCAAKQLQIDALTDHNNTLKLRTEDLQSMIDMLRKK